MFRKILIFSVIFSVAVFSFNLFAKDDRREKEEEILGLYEARKLTQTQRLFDFSELVNQIKSQYGPKEYKRRVLGIDVDKLEKIYRNKIAKVKTNGGFYKLLLRFIAEFKDGHFQGFLPTDRKSSLPFVVALVEDKVVVEEIDREKLSEKDFPFDRGDELLEIDGVPVKKLMEGFIPYIATANDRTKKSRAAYLLTKRRGWLMEVPTGEVKVKLRSLDQKRTQISTLEWEVEGIEFDEIGKSAAGAMSALMFPRWVGRYISPKEDFDPLDISTFYDNYLYGFNAENSYRCSGETRIAIPEDATVLMEEPFVAYYHPAKKGNIGYLRIPHYYPPDEDNNGRQDYEEWFEYYRWALDKLEKNTVGLVIDQDHNCGGSVRYLEELVSLFMSHDFEPLQFRFRASKRELLDWFRNIESFDRPYYINRDGMLEAYEIIKKAYYNGEYLTPFMSFRGRQKVKARNVYTKPIIMLIDYESGSGGDAFPAMMQGLGRAKLLGTTTMGLGGHVKWMSPLTYSQFETRMTMSLFYHPDKTPIENNGATPDVDYEITMDDFLDEYKGYQEFYLNELFKLID